MAKLRAIANNAKQKVCKATVKPIFEMVLKETLSAYERLEDKNIDFETFTRRLLETSRKKGE